MNSKNDAQIEVFTYEHKAKHSRYIFNIKRSFNPFITDKYSVNFYQPKMNFECHPGPLNASVLFLDKNHRAFEVFKNPTAYDEPLNIRRSDRTFWQHMKENPVSGRVEGLIHAAGFSGMLQIGYKYVDHALITALVERWRPETHTFHLPFGETTVTLQDVNVLWGLPIDGLPISGADTGTSMYTVRDKCQQVLGFTPEEAEVKGKRVKSTRVLHEIKSNFF